ncbi:MAG TPA: sulfite exporter TauE/SafE family protein [Pseudomonadales bacterium]|jgi:hypothetical protein|nr:sulfite exporter TauE/SafE family protein [Pseudomonadales bacterium]HNN85928.1 sulfite exporter TauE/SafE family protein [Pseudomonadales bacterium]
MAIAIGMLIGLVLGLTGAGGSVLAVPLLTLCLHLPLQDATGIALGAVAASAVSGVLARFRDGQTLWIPALILAAGGMALAPFGQWLALGLPEAWLASGFAVLAAIISVRMWRQAVQQPDTTHVIRAGTASPVHGGAMLCPFSPNGQFQLRPRCIAGLGSGGLAVGVLSGLFGVGGGFLIVPLLSMLSAVPYVTAVATSLVVISAVSSAGFASYLLMGHGVPTYLLAQVAVGGVIGMAVGFVVGQHIAGETLQKIFSVSVIVLSALMLMQHLS